MATTDTELIDEVRSFGQYNVEEITDPELKVALSRAKKHIKIEARLDAPDWYNREKQESALFWAAMLFSKVQTGALDAKLISVGAIEESELLAHSGGETTEWYRRFRQAKKNLLTDRLGERHRQAARTQVDGNRYYEKDER